MGTVEVAWNIAQKEAGNFYTFSNCILVYKMYNRDKQET